MYVYLMKYKPIIIKLLLLLLLLLLREAKVHPKRQLTKKGGGRFEKMY